MIVTVFLVILIAALVLGNLFLSFLKPAPAETASESRGLQDPRVMEKPRRVSEPGQALDRVAEKQNIELLNKRLDRLESTLLKINGAKFLGKKINGTVLGQKLSDFTEFKDNTKLEIAALKQDLARVKNKTGVVEKKNPGANYPISDKKLHRLVFQAGARKA